MNKIDTIKAVIDEKIRQKVTVSSIAPDDVADSLDAIAEALYVNSNTNVVLTEAVNHYEAPNGVRRLFLDFNQMVFDDFTLTLPAEPVDGDTFEVFIGGGVPAPTTLITGNLITLPNFSVDEQIQMNYNPAIVLPTVEVPQGQRLHCQIDGYNTGNNYRKDFYFTVMSEDNSTATPATEIDPTCWLIWSMRNKAQTTNFSHRLDLTDAPTAIADFMPWFKTQFDIIAQLPFDPNNPDQNGGGYSPGDYVTTIVPGNIMRLTYTYPAVNFSGYIEAFHTDYVAGNPGSGGLAAGDFRRFLFVVGNKRWYNI